MKTELPATDRCAVVVQDGDCLVIDIPMTFRKRNGRKQIVLPEGMRGEATAEDDARGPLRPALARAYRWQKMIESGEAKSNSDLARRLRLDQAYIARTIRLALLAPNIVEAILDRREPDGLSLWSLRRQPPLLWHEQWNLLGIDGN